MKTTTDYELVEGIVINVRPYKENDSIVTIYTKELGKISFIGKSLKKILNKNASSCLLFSLSEFTLIVKKGLSRMIKAQNVKLYRYIHDDIQAQSFGSYLLEYFYRYESDNVPNEQLYEILKDSLEALNNGHDPRLVYLLFNTHLLDILGSKIEVDGCHVCGDTRVAGISLEGGFVCEHHLKDASERHSGTFLKSFRHICLQNVKNIDNIAVAQEDYLELVKIIDYYIEEYTGMNFKSKKFINEFI